MGIGFALPNIGPVATPEAVIAVAGAREQLGTTVCGQLNGCFIR